MIEISSLISSSKVWRSNKKWDEICCEKTFRDPRDCRITCRTVMDDGIDINDVIDGMRNVNEPWGSYAKEYSQIRLMT